MVRLDRIFLGKNKHEEWWAYTEYFLGKINMRNGELTQNISWEKYTWEMVNLYRIFLGKNTHKKWWAYTEYLLVKKSFFEKILRCNTFFLFNSI